jgi:ComEC/Rec2-related protein
MAAAVYWTAGQYLFLIVPILPVGAAISIVAGSRGHLRSAALCIGVVAGACIGLSASARARLATEPRLPVVPQQVVTLTGVVERRSDSGGTWIYGVGLQSAASKLVRGDARGTANVVSSVAGLEPGRQVAVAVDDCWRDDHGQAWFRGVISPTRADASGELGSPDTLYALRTRLTTAAARVGEGGLLPALLLGDRDTLDERTLTLFRRAGASHILALSGMHLAALMWAVSLALRPIVGRRFARLSAIPFALFYLLIVGPRPSLVRATLMALLAIGWAETGRRVLAVELLAATFVLHLLLQPWMMGDLSFQLSYCSLAGLTIIAPLFTRLGAAVVPRAVLLPASAGLAAQMASAPVVAFAFGALYPIGVASSVVLAPLVLLFMGVGAIGVIAALLNLDLVMTVAIRVIDFLRSLVEWTAWALSMPPVHVDNRGGIALLACIVAAFIVVGLLWRERRTPWIGSE